MSDFVDFLPLYVRTEDEIRADMDADANAGLEPGDPDWVDTREVGFFHMVTQPFVIEAARIHDFISTLPAVGFIEFAYGEYLDYHAADLNTERQAAIQAIGHALFSGDVGTLVTQDTQIGTEQIDANVPPIIFLTTESGTINGPLTTPTGLTGTVAGGGSLGAGNRYYLVTAEDAAGETLPTAELHKVVTAGQKVTLNWTPVPDATYYWIYISATSGGEANAVRVTVPGLVDDGTEVLVPRTPPINNETGGKVLLAIQARDAGVIGNLAPDALTQMVTYNEGVSDVTNPEATIDGVDVESDPDLQGRLLILRAGEGPGRQVDYTRWLLDLPNVPRVQVIPLYNGGGTVGVVIMNLDGTPLDAQVQAEIQADMDPYPALGGGIAPIDHQIYVLLPTLVDVDVTATVDFVVGYSYDGIANSIAIRADIMTALENYFESLNCGDTVQVDRIKAAILDVTGVSAVGLVAPSADVTTTILPTAPSRGALGVVSLS